MREHLHSTQCCSAWGTRRLPDGLAFMMIPSIRAVSAPLPRMVQLGFGSGDGMVRDTVHRTGRPSENHHDYTMVSPENQPPITIGKCYLHQQPSCSLPPEGDFVISGTSSEDGNKACLEDAPTKRWYLIAQQGPAQLCSTGTWFLMQDITYRYIYLNLCITHTMSAIVCIYIYTRIYTWFYRCVFYKINMHICEYKYIYIYEFIVKNAAQHPLYPVQHAAYHICIHNVGVPGEASDELLVAPCKQTWQLNIQ